MRLSSTCIYKSKMAAGGAEEHFAKKLANNEKKIRDRAVNKLRAWIRSRPKDGPGFDEVDLLKIWKGLFYCMWMSDKPLIQEELALNISQLVLNFRNEQSAVLFIRTFFKTMQREWHGIDRLRLDKFYLLIRFFVKETFNFLKKTGWENRLVTKVSSVFQEEPLNPTSQAVPDGIRLHLVAVYLAELGSVIDDQVHPDELLKLLDPLFLIAAHSNNKTVTNAVKKSLFEHLGESDTEESDEKRKIIMTKVDFAAVADRLFTLASDRNILGRNRNQLFEWAKRLRKHSKGGQEGQPVQQEEALNGVPVGSKRKIVPCEASEITNGTTDGDTGKENHSREGKHKRKKKKHTEVQIEQEKKTFDNHESIAETKARKRKGHINKEENLGNSALSVSEGGTPDKVKPEPKKKKKKTKSGFESNDKTAMSVNLGNPDHKNNIGDSVIVNGSNRNENEALASESLPQLNKSNTSGSSIDDTSAVNGSATDSPVKTDRECSAEKKEKKVLRKATSSNSEPFAQFQKCSTPPAFVRKCLPKTPRSEPQRDKANSVKDQTPGSVPAKGTRKRVRIEVSKNTAHTTQDYQRSLKDSPKIPFDAQKTPTQGLLKPSPSQASLKSPPKLRRTPLRVEKSVSSRDSGQRKQKHSRTTQRARAADFF